MMFAMRHPLMTRVATSYSQQYYRKSAATVLVAATAAAASSTLQTQQHRLYSMAIARDMPDSFVEALSPYAHDTDTVCMHTAKQQHYDYIQTLRQLVPVLTLPALEGQPDCSFVEDTAVVIGKRAVITQPGHISRRRETKEIKSILQQLGYTDMYDMQEMIHTHGRKYVDATCDGGDVLNMGNGILFVGLSQRTNEAGAQMVGSCFPELELVMIPSVAQGDVVLHLKSAVTHIDSETLVAPTGAAGDVLLASMQAVERGFQVVRLPDLLACNVVVCNGVVIAQDTKCQESRTLLEHAVVQERGMQLLWSDTSELAKKDAALTCCNILLDI